MLCELLRRERELAIGNAAIDVGLVIVVRVDNHLPFDRNRLVLGVIEIDTPTEAANRGFARLVEHRGAPENGHSRRRRVFAFLDLWLAVTEPALPVGGNTW